MSATAAVRKAYDLLRGRLRGREKMDFALGEGLRVGGFLNEDSELGRLHSAARAKLDDGIAAGVAAALESVELDRLYEELLARSAMDDAKSGGEFYTPPELATLISRMADPRPGETVYDPTCGSGGLLVAAPPGVGLFGQDINEYAADIARARLRAAGAQVNRIAVGDTLNSPEFVNLSGQVSRFDVILANPPYSLKKWRAGDDRFGRFVYGDPPDSNGDSAFIQHIVASLADGGRAFVVLAPGFTFRQGREAAIRSAMLDAGIIRSVIALPPGIFYNTGVATVVLELTRAGSDDILIADCTRAITRKAKRVNIIDGDAILGVWRGREDEDGVSRVLRRSELVDDSLAVNRYVQPPLGVAIPDLPTALRNFRKACAEAREAGDSLLETLEREWPEIRAASDPSKISGETE